MIDRLNYTTHAIEDIRLQQREFAKLGILPEPHVDWVLDLLNEAVKFILPEHGELLDLTSFDQKHADLIKIPYPVTVIEAPFPSRQERLIGEGKETSSKRIGLYVEMSGAEMLRDFPGAERTDPETNGVLVISIYFIDSIKRWEISGCASYVPYDQRAFNLHTGENTEPSVKLLAEVTKEGGSFSKMAIRGHLAPLRPVVLHSMRNSGLSDVDIKTAMLGNLRDEQIMIVQLCAVLNCGNVGQENVPVPDKLARARAKSGKLPLYDYKILTLSGGVAERGSAGKNGQEGTSRRAHLRRGHIRRISKERIVWVRAALINAGTEAGVVDKTYRVTR